MADKIINWFGEESHPTDSYVYWAGGQKEVKARAKELRKAYDKIIAAGLEKELEFLLSAAYDSGVSDESDTNNEDL